MKARELVVPWIEVDAAQACATGGRELVATTDRFLPWFRAAHVEQRGIAKRAARDERVTAAALVRKLRLRLSEFPGFRIDGVVRCPRGHDALVFGWDGKDPTWPRPLLVVAVQRELDWTMRGASRRATKTAAFRRSYVSACPTCGETVQA